MVFQSYEVESWNIRGNPIKVSCKSNSRLSCEVSIVPIGKNCTGWLYYALIGILVASITGNVWTCWNSKVVPNTWLTIAMTVCLSGLWMKYSYFNPIKETVIVIKNIGIQIKTMYNSGRETSKFVDHKSITDIIINEAITMHQVLYYLAILQTCTDEKVKKPNLKLIPLFMSLHPRLDALKPVYHFMRTVLFNEKPNENNQAKSIS